MDERVHHRGVTSARTDLSLPMAGAVESLAREYAGVFSRETVRGVLADSLARLGPAAVKTYQPVLAYRFARQRLADTAASSGARPRREPVVLFVCTRNAGRSQLAAALLDHAAEGRVVVRSAGTDPASQVHDEVVDALAEVGVDTAGAFPKPLAPEALEAADVVVTMGCGETCPVFPGKRYEDWPLDDPKGQDLDTVRRIVDEVEGRVRALLAGLDRGPSHAEP